MDAQGVLDNESRLSFTEIVAHVRMGGWLVWVSSSRELSRLWRQKAVNGVETT